MQYNFLINQAFAKISVIASCSAIVLWSFMMVKNRALPIGLGIYGLFVGPVLVIAMMTGALVLDVHGEGLIIFIQAISFIAAGILLCRASVTDSAQKVGG